MNTAKLLRMLRPFVTETEKDFDPELNLLGNQRTDIYTPEYLRRHFGPLGAKWLHDYRASLAYALYLAYFDLDTERANRTLAKFLADGQVREPGRPDHGELFWIMEEKHIRDRNGNFFNGSTLLLFHRRLAGKLTAANRDKLAETLALLCPVLAEERAAASLTYVNPSLGKFAMCFLLAEAFCLASRAEDKKCFLDYLAFLRAVGMNESYSPGYITVDIVILQMVLAMTADADVLGSAGGFLRDVLYRETAFFGDRFSAPFRRGYNGDDAVHRDDILAALLGYCQLKPRQSHQDCYLTLVTATLHAMTQGDAPGAPRFKKILKTPRLLVGKIHRDCEATSYLSRGFLLGSINRYPPETTCWQCVTTAGSGWQDGPVYLTFTNQERTAAALRLEAVDANGKLMTHPYSGAFHISKIDRLYPHESFPPEPKLRCLQSRGALLCLHKIDRVDATLRKLGFNLHFHRFDGAVRIKDGGTPGDGAISGPVILELGEAWAAFFPLSRVDMAKSCLSSGEFIAPAFDVSATAEGLDLAMYNCDGEARRYVQNHVSGGFFAVVKEKGEIGALTDFLGYVDAVSVKEEWRSDRVNAHIDKRDSIREVTAKTPDVELRLGWNHYDDAETIRTVDGKPVKATSRTRVVSF